MKKYIIFTGALLLASAITGEAMAACGTGADRIDNLNTLLPGKTVCKSNGSDWEWQEFHSGASGAANNLIDYKKGSDPVDPTSPVGTWTIIDPPSRHQTVNYNYGSGGNYTYEVHGAPSGPYNFCSTSGGTDVLGATLISSSGPCL